MSKCGSLLNIGWNSVLTKLVDTYQIGDKMKLESGEAGSRRAVSGEGGFYAQVQGSILGRALE